MYPEYTFYNPYYKYLFISSIGKIPLEYNKFKKIIYTFMSTTNYLNMEYNVMKKLLINSILSNSIYSEVKNTNYNKEKLIKILPPPHKIWFIANAVLNNPSFGTLKKELKLHPSLLLNVFRTPLFQHYIQLAIDKKYQDNINQLFKKKIKININDKLKLFQKACKKEKLKVIKYQNNYIAISDNLFNIYVVKYSDLNNIDIKKPILPQIYEIDKNMF